MNFLPNTLICYHLSYKVKVSFVSISLCEKLLMHKYIPTNSSIPVQTEAPVLADYLNRTPRARLEAHPPSEHPGFS